YLSPWCVRVATHHPRLSDVHVHPPVPDDQPTARGLAVMTPLLASPSSLRQTSYGQHRLTWVDRFGVWLSRRAILRHLPSRSNLAALDLGCGYRASLLHALLPHLREGVGVDVAVAPEFRTGPLTFHEGAIENVLPQLKDDRFDVVLFISV